MLEPHTRADPDLAFLDLGYLLKQRVNTPEALHRCGIRHLAAMSSCIAPAFADYTMYWKHNGYWLFDRADELLQLAAGLALPVKDLELFFYRAYPLQYLPEPQQWRDFQACADLPLAVHPPQQAQLLGYDLVTFSTQVECSYLSCNLMAQQIAVNEHGLLDDLRQALSEVESGRFRDCEPGPCRVVAVYRVDHA